MSWPSAAGAPPGWPTGCSSGCGILPRYWGTAPSTKRLPSVALKRMDIDGLGLDEMDRSVLRAIIELYGGGPVGLETLAAALGEEAVTLEDVCEPYLMQMGFLTRTPRGRCVTRLAYRAPGPDAPRGEPGRGGRPAELLLRAGGEAPAARGRGASPALFWHI